MKTESPLNYSASLLALVLLLVCSCAAAAEFIQLRPGLHAGGQPTAEQLSELAAQGVHAVIDLRGPDEDRGFQEASRVQELGLQYIPFPITGKQDLTAANAAALKTLLDRQEGGVLLHCASGNRVGALLALMAVQEEDMPVEDAVAWGKRAGLTTLEPVVRQKIAERDTP